MIGAEEIKRLISLEKFTDPDSVYKELCLGLKAQQTLLNQAAERINTAQEFIDDAKNQASIVQASALLEGARMVLEQAQEAIQPYVKASREGVLDEMVAESERLGLYKEQTND